MNSVTKNNYDVITASQCIIASGSASIVQYCTSGSDYSFNITTVHYSHKKCLFVTMDIAYFKKNSLFLSNNLSWHHIQCHELNNNKLSTIGDKCVLRDTSWLHKLTHFCLNWQDLTWTWLPSHQLNKLYPTSCLLGSDNSIDFHIKFLSFEIWST